MPRSKILLFKANPGVKKGIKVDITKTSLQAWYLSYSNNHFSDNLQIEQKLLNPFKFVGIMT